MHGKAFENDSRAVENLENSGKDLELLDNCEHYFHCLPVLHFESDQKNDGVSAISQ